MGRFISVFQISLYLMLQYQVSCLLSLSTLPSTNHFCPHDERHALLQFKQYFTVNNSASSFCGYPKTLSWNENSSNCCSWDGVTCDGLTGHVIELDLFCSQLYGTIHPNNSLFQLSHLQLLDLSWNDFNYSHISSGIGHFPSLTHLELSFSKFSGSIPSKISYLSKLVSLGISSDDAGLLRLEPHNFRMLLKNLTQLQELALLQVNISSSLPNCLMNLSSLRTLHLPFTTLHGDLPHEILLLPNLQELELSGNNDLTGVFPMVNWSSGSNLTMLHLGLTNLSGEVPDSIGHLKSLFSLGLSHCNFFGSIPKSLGNLTQITYLDLSWNNFNGQVPSTLSNLKQLTSLILVYNNLDGTIPDGFGKLINLEFLILGDNNFRGRFPCWVVNLTQLVVFDVSNCTLTGPIPQSISKLVNLTTLDLSSNNFSGVLEFQVFLNLNKLEFLDLSLNNLSIKTSSNNNGTLPNLSTFRLSSCNINEFPNFLRNSNYLQTLDLSNNKIHGQIPKWVGQASFLQTLDLSNSKIHGQIPKWVGQASFLQTLDLSHNKIHGQIPKWVGQASFLQTLNLSHNKIHGQIPKWVGQAPYLLDLSHNYLQGPVPVPTLSMSYFLISHNKLTGDIPSSICNLSSLVLLDFSHNKLSGVIPQCLGNSSNVLSVLDLQMNDFHGTIPTTFEKSNHLRNLNLNGNHLEGQVPRSLANCKHMEVLDLGNNKLNDTFPYWLESLPELQVLILQSNRFHGPINTSRIKVPFPKLRIIDLSHNEFTGLLPVTYFRNFKAMRHVDKNKTALKYMGENYYQDSVKLVIKGLNVELSNILSIFTTIDFSDNKFKGEIPNVIGRLQALRLLNFSHNCLTGDIPLSLGNLSMLESLDLSSNQLTGDIPEQLTTLTFLAILNLSMNHLVGPIPRGYQFDTFQNDSYVGNVGLCGLPLSKECGDSEAKHQPPLVFQEEGDTIFLGGFTWKAVAMGYGCGMVLGLVMGYVMFLIGRPKWFARIVKGEQHRNVKSIKQIGYQGGMRRNQQT
ncbi:receptor-like protein 9DC3 isoform X1 [Camellia sinensis]|uniref:receptor-like protein 9DC3 isoform X1 n=2 Tax=Camellia sinensis TaxID=4442 RepID=UPI001035C1CB|nr:receptor-like protein 9DC3 isoform X1 [Camellia sinensis]